MAVTSSSLAGVRTEREMLAIAKEKLSKGRLDATRAAGKDIAKLVDEKQYCIYGREDMGFVVVSRNDAFKPVIAYSDAKFDKNVIPCGMQWWLEGMSSVMEQGSYSQNSMTGTAKKAQAVDQLCATEWGQGYPYNYKCPVFDSSKAPTGCVATAMAQIMKYFAYPAQGKGKGYYQKGGNAGRATEPTTSVYEWDKMLNQYDSEKTLPDEESLPIATIMKEAGLAAHMNYDESGSGAYATSAAYGFCNNFSYDSLAMHCYDREYFDNEKWMDIIYDELAAKRPILYTGVDKASGGHAFVFDGYDENGFIHVNWGWDGRGNGYFDIADLAPVTNPREGPTAHYNYNQTMVVGFKCQSTPDADEKYKSMICTDAYTISFTKQMLTVKSENLYNLHFLTFYGNIGVYFVSEDGKPENNVFIQAGQGGYTTASLYGMQGINNMVIYGSKVVPGNYTVYLASKAVQDEEPQPVSCHGGPVCYHFKKNEDKSVEVSEQEKMATAIQTVTLNKGLDHTKVYNLRGQFVGNDINALPSGVYIVGGKKVVK